MDVPACALSGVEVVLDQPHLLRRRLNGHIRAQVRPGSGQARFRIARIRDIENGARLGISLAKEQEVERQVAGDDGEVGLDQARAGAGVESLVESGGRRIVHVRCRILQEILDVAGGEIPSVSIAAPGTMTSPK